MSEPTVVMTRDFAARVKRAVEYVESLTPQRMPRRRFVSRGGGGAGGGWQWAQVVEMLPDRVRVRWVNVDGSPVLEGDPIDAFIYGYDDAGTTVGPWVASETTPLLLNQYVRVERQASGFRSAESVPPMEWWLKDVAIVTCYGGA